MRNAKKVLISLLLVGVMVFTTACGASFDASGYVEACLELLTRGESAEYCKLTERSEEQAKADYEESINNMMADFESLGLSEELVAKYRTLFEDIYKATKYNVLEASEVGEDHYTVDVEIEQITGIFNGVAEELNTAAYEYGEQLASSGETIDEAAINEWVYNKLFEILNENLATATYNEKQTITVNVVLEGEVYTIPEEDYILIDKTLIDLGDLAY